MQANFPPPHPHPPHRPFALQWLNAVLDRAHGIWPTNRKLKSLDDPHLLKGVVAVLEVLAPETVHFDPNSNRVHTARMSMLESEYLENLDHKAIARLISESLGELGVPLGALTEQDLATGTISPKLLLFPLAFLFECFCRPEKEVLLPVLLPSPAAPAPPSPFAGRPPQASYCHICGSREGGRGGGGWP